MFNIHFSIQSVTWCLFSIFLPFACCPRLVTVFLFVVYFHALRSIWGFLFRYPWPLLRPLVDYQLDQVLQEMDAEGRVEVGPSLPLPGYDNLEALRVRLHSLLDDFTDAAPFTLQRLAELLLEPQKQYTRLGKLVRHSPDWMTAGGNKELTRWAEYTFGMRDFPPLYVSLSPPSSLSLCLYLSFSPPPLSVSLSLFHTCARTHKSTFDIHWAHAHANASLLTSQPMDPRACAGTGNQRDRVHKDSLGKIHCMRHPSQQLCNRNPVDFLNNQLAVWDYKVSFCQFYCHQACRRVPFDGVKLHNCLYVLHFTATSR